MTRTALIEALKVAGINNDHQAFARLFSENKISFEKAGQAFSDGCRIRLAKQYGE